MAANPSKKGEVKYVLPKDYLYISYSFQPLPLDEERIRGFLSENANYNYYLQSQIFHDKGKAVRY